MIKSSNYISQIYLKDEFLPRDFCSNCYSSRKINGIFTVFKIIILFILLLDLFTSLLTTPQIALFERKTSIFFLFLPRENSPTGVKFLL